MSDTIKVRISDVHKSFGKTPILQGLSLTVWEGEVMVILGPSGSGKTTLLRCINFLERADAGTLTIGNISVDMHSVSKKHILEVRRKTAFVFQNFNLFRHKSALQNVMEGLVTPRKIPEDQARALSQAALDRVGLQDKYDSYPSQLSGGQQQRVAIARALVLNPEVILFDEPTSALDPELVGETLQVIKDVARDGITMIIVTHEISFAAEVANHIVFMDGGVIVEEGDPRELLSNPREERTKQFLKRIRPELSYSI
ncbi:amino acid ABC transporter ATP-binding protein [Treponema primitia]|uniref:amino acid ABC transporter ATP-binding protein n=1 Tax=Treponema primitia TaxID=88058 RepID=UPI00025552C5|nr:amino acid ABC transporter ATP-binding protein [Treponema primitia]